LHAPAPLRDWYLVGGSAARRRFDWKRCVAKGGVGREEREESGACASAISWQGRILPRDEHVRGPDLPIPSTRVGAGYMI